MKDLKPIILYLIFCCMGCTNIDLSDSSLVAKTDPKSNLNEYENAIATTKHFATQGLDVNTKAPVYLDIKDVQTKKVKVNFSSLITTKSTSTLVDLPDTTSINIYTVTFEKNGQEGFSIVTGDERLQQVYAYTECGNLSDTIYNKGLAATLSQIPFIVQNDLLQTYAPRMTTPVDEEVNLNVGPLLKTKWDQRYPYNLMCPIVQPCGQRAPTGCTATAIAQVIAFLDVPRSRYQGTFNYAAINSSSSIPYGYENMVAKLMKFIGDKVGMNYGCDGSGAFPKGFRSTLDLWGIKYTYEENANVNITTLVSDINRGYPHISSGHQKTGEKGTHTWVWDGVRGKFHYTSNGRGTINYTPMGTVLFSCNWGWSGKADGWYAQSLMEHPTNQNAAYLAQNTQLYITSIQPNRSQNSCDKDNLPPF